jgi:lysophospholipase L1-like esterase
MPPPPDPVEYDLSQMGDHWHERVEEFRRENATLDPGGIVMVGDSITQGLCTGEFFPGIPIINRGISGDRIIGVIARLDESIFDLEPRRIFLLIGVNDAGMHPEMEFPEYEHQLRFLFDQIARRCPETDVIIQSIMPIRGEYAHANARIREVNSLLRTLAQAHGFRYLDLQPLLSDENGEMRPEFADDGVHPNVRGCEVWCEALRPFVEN